MRLQAQLLYVLTAVFVVRAFESIDLLEDCLQDTLQLGNKSACGPVLRNNQTESSEPEPSGLSWVEAEECLGDVCIYMDPDFYGGTVLLSTPYNARKMEQYPKIHQPHGGKPPFTMAQVPGKGRGLVASKLIKRGEIIMVLPPTMTTQLGPPLGDVALEQRIPFYDKAVEMLPPGARDLFMSQYGDDVNMKMDKNCFRMYLHTEDEGGDHLGCFPQAARFNHDCRPNIHYRMTNTTHTTVAVRDIAEGEELTVSYIDATIPHVERQHRLRDWGFNCTCPLCSGSAEQIAESDARLEQIKNLEDRMDDFTLDSLVTADMGGKLVDLYEEERLHIYLGTAYTRAAINYALFGQTEKAMQYAAVAAQAVERESGAFAPDMNPMKTLAETPEKHWSWGKRRSDLFS